MADVGGDGDSFVKLSMEYAELAPIAAATQTYRTLLARHAEAEDLLQDSETDADMRELAVLERDETAAEIEAQQQKLQRLLLPKDADDARNAILEIRAGTGGEEAALFAGTLLRMYHRYADLKGWHWDPMRLNETDLGGMKEATVTVSGRGVFSKLKFESGVHRVQRIPETETGGRIHTSAATVAVLPEVQDVDIDIEEKDLKIDTYRAQGAGGQHVNTTDSAVRITHMPSGVVVTCQDEKSQHKNRAKAMTILRSRLYEEERRRRDVARSQQRRDQVGSGDRSERVRTYNFPQGRVTDHRINLTLYKLDQMLNGEVVDEVVDALIAADEAERLASLADGGNGG